MRIGWRVAKNVGLGADGSRDRWCSWSTTKRGLFFWPQNGILFAWAGPAGRGNSDPGSSRQLGKWGGRFQLQHRVHSAQLLVGDEWPEWVCFPVRLVQHESWAGGTALTVQQGLLDLADDGESGRSSQMEHKTSRGSFYSTGYCWTVAAIR